MCDYIDAACFMANLVSTRRDKESFNLQELGRIRLKVEAALRHENAVIEWTRGSFLAAMYFYSDLFTKQDELISITKKAHELLTEDFVTTEFNAALSGPVRHKMQRAIREACGVAA